MCLYEYDEEKHMEVERREHYERGLADGIAKGKRVGEKRGKREIILHMLSQNQSPETISKLTGEPLSYIEDLTSLGK